MAIDQKNRADAKARLDEELRSSTNDLEQIERDIIALTREGALEGGVPSNHMADDGSDFYERERLLRIQVELAERIELVEGALERLDAGTYGRCERCGKQIAAARLKALPFAGHCISCQEIVDAEQHVEGVKGANGRA
ncbi:MAG TPA: TraR/DksA C4-type zinc finger protein [Thermomicrobiales bacterium]|nr:TraR/DksA C4-type zinc finger protein [Thermomicrobiales bacterium]